MAIQVSPGIVTTEIDQTQGPAAVSTSDAGFAGPFQWGPSAVVTSVASEDDLVGQFGKPDANISSSWFTAQSFLAYSDLLRVVRVISVNALNATSAAKTLTGTVTAVGANNTWTGGGGFLTTGLLVNQSIVIGGTSYSVNSVINTSAFTTTVAPAANVTANTITAYGLLIQNIDDYTTNWSQGSALYGDWVAKYPGTLGNSLSVSTCASANAFQSTPAGTIALTAGSNTVTGTSTTFTTDLRVGDFIVANGQSYPVATVTNSTQIILGTAAISTVTLATTQWSRTWQYASVFDAAPGTSPFASARGGSADELHIVVVDTGGIFSGQAGTILERYSFLSKASDSKDSNGQGNYYVNVINQQSAYIWWLSAPTTSTTNWGSAASLTTFGASAAPETVSLQGGQSLNSTVADGDLENGFDLFASKDNVDISLIITGPVSAAVASYVIQNICEERGDCIATVSPTKSSVVNNAGNEVTSITSFRNALPDSSFGVCDGNWKYAYDKYNDVYTWVPLNGDVAGLCAQTDQTNDPWFSPAGFTRGNVKNAIKLAFNPTQQNRDDLYKIGVNPIVSFPAQGIVLYGDKTLLTRPSAFDRINVRRLFIILEKTITQLAQASLFEFNDDFTQSQFRNVVGPYLRQVKSLRGITDYLVVCDSTNNTDEVIQQNQFVGDIYVKPARSINFIQLNFIAVNSGVSFQTITGQS